MVYLLSRPAKIHSIPRPKDIKAQRQEQYLGSAVSQGSLKVLPIALLHITFFTEQRIVTTSLLGLLLHFSSLSQPLATSLPMELLFLLDRFSFLIKYLVSLVSFPSTTVYGANLL